MKKNILIVLGIILIGIVIGLCLYFFLPNDRLDYDKLLEAGHKNYEVDIMFNNEDNGLSFWGNYNSETNRLELEDDIATTYQITGNIYEAWVKKMDNKEYKNGTMFKSMINLQQIYNEYPEFELFLKEKNAALCEYEIDDNRIYSISCDSNEKNITISFDFKD